MNSRVLLFLFSLVYAFSASAVNDYFGKNKLSFLGDDYNLVWSANSQNTKIEDFIPKGPSYTQFENKFSIYFMKDTQFEKVITDKQNELEIGKSEGHILDFKNTVLSNDEILCSYTSELSQGGAVLVVQFSAFKYIRSGSDVIVLEWEHRAYKKADSFKKDIEKKKEKWLDSFVKFDLSGFNLK